MATTFDDSALIKLELAGQTMLHGFDESPLACAEKAHRPNSSKHNRRRRSSPGSPVEGLASSVDLPARVHLSRPGWRVSPSMKQCSPIAGSGTGQFVMRSAISTFSLLQMNCRSSLSLALKQPRSFAKQLLNSGKIPAGPDPAGVRAAQSTRNSTIAPVRHFGIGVPPEITKCLRWAAAGLA